MSTLWESRGDHGGSGDVFLVQVVALVELPEHEAAGIGGDPAPGKTAITSLERLQTGAGHGDVP